MAGGYPPGAAPGYPPPGQHGYHPQGGYGQPAMGQMGMMGSNSTTVVMMPGQAAPQPTTILMAGNCPRCHSGTLVPENNASMCVLMIILAILFFPIGLLYLLCIPKDLTCPHCGYTA